MATNLYEVLGIAKEASPEEVRKAYRKRALQTHPDRLPQNVSLADKKAAEEQFRLVNNAYEVLNNTENRKLYDKHGVWPPPAEQPAFERSSSRDAFSAFGHDPFANDPFFSSGFGRSRRPFAFTDPFELFNSLFGDLHSAFDNDPLFANTPFFRSPFDDPFFRTSFGSSPFGASPFGASPFGASPFGRGDPFGGSLLGRSPFAGMLGGGSMFPAIEDISGTRVYSSSTEAAGRNGQWVSRSQMTRTVNGRTEVITKRIDAEGNEHITYSSPEGERYTINGVEQPSRGSIEAPRRSGSHRSSRPAPIADVPANPPAAFASPPPAQAQAYSVPIAGPSSSHSHRHSHTSSQTMQPERRSSRHSQGEHRVSHDDPRRTYTNPVPAGRSSFSSRFPADHRVSGRTRTNASSSSSLYEAAYVEPTVHERERGRRHTTNVPAPSPVVPDGYDAAAHTSREAAPSRHSREKERDRRDSKLRRSRESRDYREPAVPTSAKRMSVDGDKAREKEKEQHRGWRGW